MKQWIKYTLVYVLGILSTLAFLYALEAFTAPPSPNNPTFQEAVQQLQNDEYPMVNASWKVRKRELYSWQNIALYDDWEKYLGVFQYYERAYNMRFYVDDTSKVVWFELPLGDVELFMFSEQ